MLYLSSHMRFWYMSHMRKFVSNLNTEARGLYFGIPVYIHHFFAWAGREGSGDTVYMRSCV